MTDAEAKRAKAAAACRKWYAKNKEREWYRQLQKNYKISKKQYATMLASQNDSCAICGIHKDSLDVNLSVDHDHSCCSKIPTCGTCNRGLLCQDCNRALGMLNDDPGVLKKAYLYLIQSEVVQCG